MERFNDFPKVTQLIAGELCFRVQVMLSLLLAASGSQFMAFVNLASVSISRGFNFPI